MQERALNSRTQSLFTCVALICLQQCYVSPRSCNLLPHCCCKSGSVRLARHRSDGALYSYLAGRSRLSARRAADDDRDDQGPPARADRPNSRSRSGAGTTLTTSTSRQTRSNVRYTTSEASSTQVLSLDVQQAAPDDSGTSVLDCTARSTFTAT